MEEIQAVARIDLNHKTNRIPSDDEVPRLRELAASKTIIMEEIEAKIHEAETTNGDNLQYDSLIAERDTLLETFGLLEGLIHPIRRASDDILRYILSWVCSLTEKPRWAEPFTQVCQHWRRIAITTPSLWKNIRPPLSKDASTISEYWILAAERVKLVPAIIKIHASPSEAPPSLSDLHSCCPLTIFPNIESLYIGINDETLPHIIAWLSRTPNTVSLLHFYHNYNRLPYDSPTFRDFCIMAALVKPIVLEYPYISVPVPTSRITDADVLPTVRRLNARLVGSASGLSEYFRAFPSLTSLQLYYCHLEIEEAPPSRITLEHVKHIELNGNSFPWKVKFRCPALESVHIDSCPISPDICEFIRTHKSIRRVLVKFYQSFDSKGIIAAIPPLQGLIKRFNDSQDDHRMELTLWIQLHPETDAMRFTSFVKSEGISWTLLQQGGSRYLQHIWN